MTTEAVRMTDDGAAVLDFEPYLTKRQVAARLAVGVRTLERMVATADLPAHRVGAQRRFLWSEVVAWIAAGERR
jgi:excisionase family DNA binding protein